MIKCFPYIIHTYIKTSFKWVCDLLEKNVVLVPDWFSFITFALNYLTLANDILSHYIINAMICKEIKFVYNWDVNLNQLTPNVTQQ